MVETFVPVIDELWPRLEDHKYRWELYGYGLPDGYDKLVASDIIALLIEALKSIGVAGEHRCRRQQTVTCSPQSRRPQPRPPGSDMIKNSSGTGGAYRLPVGIRVAL
jgi:hypothetical protein